MRKILLSLFLCLPFSLFAQNTAIKVQQDTLTLTGTNLRINIPSKDTIGFLYNSGNGMVSFRSADISGIGGSGSPNGLELFLSSAPVSQTMQQLKWWKSPDDLYNFPKVAFIGASQGKGAFTSHYDSSIAGRLTTFIKLIAPGAVCTNYCENGYNTRQLMPNGSNPYVDQNRNITKALADGNKLIIFVTPSNDFTSGGAGGVTPVPEILNNVAVIQDACVTAGATLLVFSSFPRNDFSQSVREQLYAYGNTLVSQYGKRAAAVHRLVADASDPLQINPQLYTGDNIHLNDKGAAVCFRVMRDVIMGYFTSNYNVASYLVQKSPDLVQPFTDFRTVTTHDQPQTEINLSQAFYRVRINYHDGLKSAWSNVVKGTSTGGGTSGNLPPTVNAGADQSITLPATLTLSATASDADGSITSYSWYKVSGGNAAISSSGSATTGVTGLVAGTYVFRCTVTDNNGGVAYDEVQVTVSGGGPAIARTAKFNFSLLANNVTGYTNVTNHPHQQVRTATDPSGIGINTISTNAWPTNNGQTAIDGLAYSDDGGGFVVAAQTLQSVYFTSSTSATNNLQITGLTPGRTCRILVTANAVSSPRNTRVSLNGNMQEFNAVNNSSKAAVFDNITIPSGGSIELAVYAKDASSQFGLVSAVVVDEYEGETTPENQAPTVNAGNDQTLSMAASATLTATASDTDGSISQYHWTKISGPQVDIADSTSATTNVTGLIAGTYVFRCTVTDNENATAYDDVQLTVTAPSVSRTGQFNFSANANPVSGFTNLTGHPHQNVISNTHSSGIGVTTISTASWFPNGTISALDGIAVQDDGGGYAVPSAALGSVFFTNRVDTNYVDNIRVTNLTPGRHVRILVIANAFSEPRITKVTLNGVTREFNAVRNSSKSAVFDFITVPANGEITMAVYAHVDSKFGLISALVVQEYTQ